MKHPYVAIVLRVLSGLLGGAMLLSGILDAIDRYHSLGVGISIILGAALLLTAVCPTRWLRAVPRGLAWTLGSTLLIALGFFVFLFLFGRCDTVRGTEDAVIVLGCRVRGTEPSESLKRRLDRAVAYHRQNPDAVLIVSGGKGSDEQCSEAQAMSRYLLEHGVPPEVILLEDRSASTEENFRFCKPILDAHFGRPYTTVFITSDYHILRASAFARAEGFDPITHAAAPTPWRSVFTSGWRETCAVIAQWLGP